MVNTVSVKTYIGSINSYVIKLLSHLDSKLTLIALSVFSVAGLLCITYLCSRRKISHIKPDWNKIIYSNDQKLKNALINFLQNENTCAYEGIGFIVAREQKADTFFEEDGSLSNLPFKDEDKKGRFLTIILPSDPSANSRWTNGGQNYLRACLSVQPQAMAYRHTYHNKFAISTFEEYNLILQSKISKTFKNTILYGQGLELL